MKEKQPKIKGPSRKEIQSKIQESVNKTMGDLHLEQPSKKVKKVVRKTSKLLARKIKRDLKVSQIKSSKASKNLNGKSQTSIPVA
jgi:hypothetical protein